MTSEACLSLSLARLPNRQYPFSSLFCLVSSAGPNHLSVNVSVVRLPPLDCPEASLLLTRLSALQYLVTTYQNSGPRINSCASTFQCQGPTSRQAPGGPRRSTGRPHMARELTIRIGPPDQLKHPASGNTISAPPRLALRSATAGPSTTSTVDVEYSGRATGVTV